MTTKRTIIEESPRSYLARELANNDWPMDQKVITVSGLDAPETKQSNLHKAIKMAGTTDYVIGGRAGQNLRDGYHFAVKCK